MKLAVDSDTLRYFVHANQEGYEPTDDPEHLATQRVAAFRLFVYGPVPYVVSTVLRQAQRHPDLASRWELDAVWIGSHCLDVDARYLDGTKLNDRVAALQLIHSGPKNLEDCRIVAECEQSQMDVLVSNDKNLRRLSTARMFIGTLADCWERLQIPRGTSRELHPLHPLATAVWWRW